MYFFLGALSSSCMPYQSIFYYNLPNSKSWQTLTIKIIDHYITIPLRTKTMSSLQAIAIFVIINSNWLLKDLVSVISKDPILNMYQKLLNLGILSDLLLLILKIQIYLITFNLFHLSKIQCRSCLIIWIEVSEM